MAEYFIIYNLKRRIFFVLLVIILPFTGCYREIDHPTYPDIWGKPSKGIRSAITVEQLSWKYGDHAWVTVVLDNVSGGDIGYRTIPSFTLDNQKYNCPVNITGDNFTLSVNERAVISLEQGSTVFTKIDVASLKWGMSFAAVWPDKAFYTLVPPGKHTLRLEIEILDESLHEWVYSNEIDIEISG